MLRLNKSKNKLLQRAWNKYKESAFIFEILLYCDKKDLLFFEQKAIDKYIPEYNILSFAYSSLGYKHTADTKEKMSLAKKGIKYGPMSEEHKLNLSNSKLGHTVSEETRAKISASLLGSKLSIESIEKRTATRKLNGVRSPMLGKKLTKEHIQKLVESNKKRRYICSEETKQKLREASKKQWAKIKEEAEKGISHPLLQRTVSDETKLKQSLSRRGKVLSSEHKKNISKGLKGKKKPWLKRPLSEEHKQKISDGGKGRKVSEETKQKLREAAKKQWAKIKG